MSNRHVSCFKCGKTLVKGPGPAEPLGICRACKDRQQVADRQAIEARHRKRIRAAQGKPKPIVQEGDPFEGLGDGYHAYNGAECFDCGYRPVR